MPAEHTPDPINPYAPPQADYAPPTGAAVEPSEAGQFYAMSVTKLWVMSVLTLGIYNLWFWWRQWRHVRDHHGVDVSVFWRTIFAPFMYFDFNKRVKAALEDNQLPSPGLFEVAPTLYLVANIADRILSRVETENMALSLVGLAILPLATACLASTQSAINAVLDRQGYQGPVNDQASAGAIVGGILGGLLWALALVGLFA